MSAYRSPRFVRLAFVVPLFLALLQTTPAQAHHG